MYAQGHYYDGRGRSGLGMLGRKPERTFRVSTGVTRSPRYVEPVFTFPRRPVALTFPRRPVAPIKRPPHITGAPTRHARGRRTHARFARPRRPSKAAMVRARKQFLTWLKKWQPQLYARAVASANQSARQPGGLGQLHGWWDDLSAKLSDLGGKYLQFKTQKEILDAQLERTKQGLPPFETAHIAPTIAIRPDPGTTAQITGAIGVGMERLLPWVIGGVGAAILLPRLMKR